MVFVGGMRVSILAVALALTTCVDSLRVHRSLAPAPAADCVQTALARSPHVRDVSVLPREDSDVSYGIRIWDPQAPDSLWRAGVHLVRARDSAAVITITFTWIPDYRPRNQSERQRVQRLATALLTEVTARCAPGTTAPITCIEDSTHPLVPRRSCRAAV